MEAEFKCERCKPGHDFKSKQNLKQHHQSASHKRKFDPEFAAAEELEKATKKATRGGKETARKAGGKETARKAGGKETARKAGDKEKVDVWHLRCAILSAACGPGANTKRDLEV